MTFGQYIRFRREKILRQERDEISFQKGYLTSIETDARRPTKKEVIQRLGKALGILDTTAQEWLWYYSLSNKEPYPFPAMYQKPIVTKDDLPVIFHNDAPSLPANGSQTPALYNITPYSSAPLIANDTPDIPPDNSRIHLQYGSSEQDVLSTLGAPDKKILIPSRCKWIYEKEGLHIIFTDGKVSDIGFK